MLDEAAAAWGAFDEPACRSGGESTPGALAAELGLTSGGVMTMRDRLAQFGHVSREPGPGDRRKVLVRITSATMARAWEIYGPIAEEGVAEMPGSSATELRTVLDFRACNRELQQRHREANLGPAQGGSGSELTVRAGIVRIAGRSG
ncbi:hypothetical protein [Nocardia sp. NPDC046763]|uniref:hypothetical protein n=1 Tax=Nocardia sp. NPDC046763 TaxID=3155256 RepID=UPI0033C3E047